MSLGFRPGNDHIAERVRAPLPTRSISISEPDTAPAPRWRGAVRSAAQSTLKVIRCCHVPVVHGVVPTFFYSTFAFLVPFLLTYMDYDFTDDTVRGVTIGGSALAALIVVYANDCCCWFNMMLAFHTALEVKVVDTALHFAYQDGTSDEHMALSIAGAIIVIVHLVPFFLIDGIPSLLTVLAFAGVVVNTTIVVVLDPDRLLLVAASALALLSVTMIVVGVCEVRTSLFGMLRVAVRENKYLKCDSFVL